MAPREASVPSLEVLIAEAVWSTVIDYGVSSGVSPVGTNSLTDQSKRWATNVHRNRLVKIIKGAGAGQIAVIDGNSSQTLIIKQAWAIGLDTTSHYVILGMDVAQALKDVLGGGDVISATNPLPVDMSVAYEGIPYSNSDTATDDNPRRFETTTLILRDAVIKVTGSNQLLGDASGQHFELAAGGSIGISFLDLSKFYFKNAAAGQNGTIMIFGTRA